MLLLHRWLAASAGGEEVWRLVRDEGRRSCEKSWKGRSRCAGVFVCCLACLLSLKERPSRQDSSEEVMSDNTSKPAGT